MHYIKTKKAQTSECNICGKIRKMTWDHVPPKSALLNPAVFANTLFSDLPTETAHMREYQSGINPWDTRAHRLHGYYFHFFVIMAIVRSSYSGVKHT